MLKSLGMEVAGSCAESSTMPLLQMPKLVSKLGVSLLQVRLPSIMSVLCMTSHACTQLSTQHINAAAFADQVLATMKG